MTLDDRTAFEARLTTIGFDESELETMSDGTLFQPLDLQADTSDFPNLLTDDLQMKHSLGQGGMGVVQLARQRAMQRDVAVKRVLPERRGAASELLVEARVMGNLEHPNVVPVYSLGTDDGGDVLFVMKRVTGISWGDRLAQQGVDLERDLRVLIEVCQAVHYAHERGVLHRDIKPANVMIGDFGEVYVLDWGLAVASGSRPIPGVPLASEVRVVTGTPPYMAPEMAIPEGGIDRRTDVYLLGACIHELITGKPPHDDKTTKGALHKAFLSAVPEYGPEVDAELAGIARRALARDKDERYATVRELAEAVEVYLSHAGVRHLLKAAGERLEWLKAAADDEEGDAKAQVAFDEGRFGFGQVLEVWPSSQAALDGRREAQVLMAERELRRGRPVSASLLLRALKRPPEDLVAAVDKAKRTLEDERARVESLEHDRDLGVGATSRSVFLVALGFIWMVLSVWIELSYEAPPHTPVVVFQCLTLVGSLILAVVFRRRIAGNEVSRQLGVILLAGVLTTTIVWSMGWAQGWKFSDSAALSHLLLMMGSISGAVVDRRLLPAAALQALAVLTIWLWPAHAPLLSGVLGFLSLSSVWFGRVRAKRAA